MVERVVVVGGGVIGLSVAYALDQRGVPVTVIDAGPVERAASHVNAGWIVPTLAEPVPAPGLIATSLRWMLRSDSPLYIRPRFDPDFLRWTLRFWRSCNARDYHAGTLATAALGAQSLALYDAMRAAGVAYEEHRDGILFHVIGWLAPGEIEIDAFRGDALRRRRRAAEVERRMRLLHPGNEELAAADVEVLTGEIDGLPGQFASSDRQKFGGQGVAAWSPSPASATGSPPVTTLISRRPSLSRSKVAAMRAASDGDINPGRIATRNFSRRVSGIIELATTQASSQLTPVGRSTPS